MAFFSYLMKNDVFEILKQFENSKYEAYIVGGFVRDKLLGISSLDIDICTNANKDQIKRFFPNSKYKDYFCFSLKIDKYDVEITTFRKEFNYDGRKPLKIEEASTLLDDLQRRDFTINTICLDSSGNIIDLMGGVEDLNNKLIKVVGDSDKKIKEDSLRILRAIRFSTLYNFKLDKSLEKAINKYGSNIQNLSPYRKRYELDKILSHENFKYGISLLKKFKLDEYLKISIPNDIKYCDNYLGIYAQIDCFDNLFSHKELKQIEILKKYLHKDLDLYDMYVIGKENLLILQQIHDKNLIKIYDNLIIKKDKDLNVSYNDIKETLIKKNIEYSYIKENIIKKILYKELSNTKDEIIKYVNNNY